MLVVTSNLEAVTVHAEGALCTRVATVPMAGGMLPSQVRINGLPLSLQPGSLRASVVHGPSGLAVRDLRPTYDVQLPPEVDVPTEHRAVEEAEHRLSDLTQQLARVGQELEALSKLSPGFPPRPKEAQEPRDAPVSAMLSLMSFVDTELAALHSRKLELERQQRDAEAELRLRRSRVAEASSSVRGQRARVYRAVVLTLSGPLPADQGARLALEYAVQGARWVPTYDLRLPRTLEEGTLRMRASVLQRTGEDWTGVKLAVSTADLARHAEVPELKALRIGRHQPPPARSGWREAPPGLEELFAGYDASLPTPVQPEPTPQPAVFEQPRKKNKSGAMPMEAEPDSAMEEVAEPPPPPPGAAPRRAPARPSAAAPFPEKKKSRGGVMMPRASRPPPPDPFKAEDEGSFDDDEDGLSLDAASLGGGGGGGERSPPRQEPSDALLDYDRLTMAPAEDLGARGRLQPRPGHVTRELVALAEVHAQIDITVRVALSLQQTSSVWAAPAPAWSQPPRTSSPHFDARFEVETRADVPSDGAWHTVPVLSVPVGLSAEYVCVPSVESRAFRTVRVENRTPYPLLAGPVDVTLENEFLMTSPLPTMAPGSTQRLGLGVEESIKVARNTRFDEATGGMFGGSTMLTHHVSVELANRLANRVLVEVCERVPTVPASTEKDIKVEELEVAPLWQKRLPLPGEEKVEGERAWRVVLQPGEAQTLKATWTVKIPGNKMLGGGNRRT
ncbi:mucoidy inhibitor MuiA family protein [Myxococcus sp. AM009]|uniref:mucoidy inhibitor MuiA family protein n=1 Tax=unclassified Myxococcus TaxID=2648731 RepID=UPI00159602C5|nr:MULTISPECIES: mucoidy inhibitor MuiA family protein [unclassified Myxococcus]NVJ01349.1 mucoidy inhibitor MuiA family protein [Myxococcus sp. AM009]NVJ13046.1 mucoidy inhibitor MuiA family protein [Myxococcus sp. AM010]